MKTDIGGFIENLDSDEIKKETSKRDQLLVELDEVENLLISSKKD